MKFTEYILEPRELIRKRVESFFLEKKNEDLPKIFKEQKLLEKLETFLIRGKLVRGSLFILTAKMLGLKITPELIDIACGIELMHSSLLVQDDVIDRDYTRRGEKTVFAKFEDQGKELKAYDPYHYGVSSAFVVADVAFFFAIELIANLENKKINELLRYYSHEIYLVAISESVDSLFGQTDREPTEEDIFAVYLYKTARYTFSLPFEMASIVAGKEKIQKKLGELGEKMGIIYQLRDDELGIFGDEKETGKPVGSDIRENKKTYIRYLLFASASLDDRKVLADCFGNSSRIDSLTKVKTLYSKYKIDEKVNVKISSLAKESGTLIKSLSISDEFENFLYSLLEFNLNRKK